MADYAPGGAPWGGTNLWSPQATPSPYIPHDPLFSRGEAIFAGTFATLFSIIGVPGNLWTACALLRSPALRAHPTTAFIVSLALSDLLFCALCLPATAVRFFTQRWPLGDTLCAAFALLFYGNVAVSVLSMTAVAINRYVLIMWPGAYRRVYSSNNVMLMVAAVWLGGFALLLPPLFGVWGSLGLHPRTFSCTILQKNGSSPKKAVFVLGFALPCAIMAIAYWRIYRRVRAAKRALLRHGQSVSVLPGLPIKNAVTTSPVGSVAVPVAPASKEKEVKKSNVNSTKGKGAAVAVPDQGKKGAGAGNVSGSTFRRRDDGRLTRLMLTVFCSFLVCFLPLTIVNVAESSMPPILQIIASVLAYASGVINPFIYAATNRQYRTAYRRVLCGKPTGVASSVPERHLEGPSATATATGTGTGTANFGGGRL